MAASTSQKSTSPTQLAPEVHRVEVATRDEFDDARGNSVALDLRGAGLAGIRRVRCIRGYALEIAGGVAAAGRAAREVLADAIVDVATVLGPDDPPAPVKGAGHRVMVVKKPGVMDPAADGVLRALRTAGIAATAVRTYHAFLVEGDVKPAELRAAAARCLGNEAIEAIYVGDEPIVSPALAAHDAPFARVDVELPADDADLLEVSRKGGLSLSLLEMQAIREHYRKAGRKPTDVELETIAQTWSEHCKHKTLAGAVELDGQRFDNLLKDTIFFATRELALPWCISVFVDNAGVIDFDGEHCATFKVETHNHPSAIEPYGGAGTGVGGVLRDTLGTGLGARPIVSTDVFCFGPPGMAQGDVPPGALHPLRTLKGVVAGVRDYGNRMGIPTANGAVVFDPRFTGNPLVFCGSVGLIPRAKVEKEAKPGDAIVVIGGRTGRDGIHGATFSSRELHHESETLDSGAVQIGNAITEKKVMDALIRARDLSLYDCVTDCGAGGLSSAVGEMAAELGAEVELAHVPLKYQGLSYAEIWISEAQERMVLAVPQDKLAALLELMGSEDVEAVAIGTFTDSGRLVLRYQGHDVGDLDLAFLHDGLPRITRKAITVEKGEAEPSFAAPSDLGAELTALLAAPDVASKEWIVRQYDHEVQAGMVMKPFVGAQQRTPSDAAVVRPKLDSNKGLAIGNGIAPRYGDIDPYAMGLLVIDEAIRNVIAAGARPDRIALLDNFCAGNCERPEILGEVARVALACRDAALALGTPFISGKDSLNNEFRTPSGVVAIPTTLLISAIGIIDDVRRCVSSDLKRSGSKLVLIGTTRAELGGSQYYARRSLLGKSVPRVDLDVARRTFERLAAAIGSKLLLACHDLSDGGLGTALAEMTFDRAIGVRVDLAAVPRQATPGVGPPFERDDVLLFSESPTRFLCEVAPDALERLVATLGDVPHAVIGETDGSRRVVIHGVTGKPVVDVAIATLEAAWKNALDFGSPATPATTRRAGGAS
jgi:phosphoribosylformylglycinamidine synthase II